MRINGAELPESPLLFLRSLLGDEQVDEIGQAALDLACEYPTTEERVCLAEHFRLFANASAAREAVHSAA